MTEKKTTKKATKVSHKVAKEKVSPEPIVAPKTKYFFAVGRRKTAIARVKLFPGGTGQIKVNKRDILHYFPTLQLQRDATQSLDAAGFLKKVDVDVSANGGGVVAQAQAVRLGVARALVRMDTALKTVLKKHGLMTRDARKKERKKPGLKRARRAPQWQKR